MSHKWETTESKYEICTSRPSTVCLMSLNGNRTCNNPQIKHNGIKSGPPQNHALEMQQRWRSAINYCSDCSDCTQSPLGQHMPPPILLPTIFVVAQNIEPFFTLNGHAQLPNDFDSKYISSSVLFFIQPQSWIHLKIY